MIRPDTNLAELREPWHVLGDDHIQLEKELAGELTSQHELFGVTVTAIARRLDQDDVLFSHAEGFSVVHLTYAGPERAPWPMTQTYGSWQHFMRSEFAC